MDIFFVCPERLHWQAYKISLAGLRVKTRRPAKFTPPAGASGRGNMGRTEGVLIDVKEIATQSLFLSPK